MTNRAQSKSILIPLAVAAVLTAIGPAVVAYADTAPMRWLDAWRIVPLERVSVDRAATVKTADDARTATSPRVVTARETIPGANCAPQTVDLSLVQPARFDRCVGPAPRDRIVTPTWSAIDLAGLARREVPTG